MAKDLSGAQTGMAPRAGVNDPRPNNMRGRNVFPQSYKHLTTDRYGEYSPFFWCKAERGDVQNLKTDHDLHTFTLQSPMVSDVEMTKSFIKVPMQAIYPINWEKMMTIPTQGDDVPFEVKSLVDPFKIIEKCVSILNDSSTTLDFYVRALNLLELVSSHGSLFERFNYHFNYVFTLDPSGEALTYSPDHLADYLWNLVLSVVDENGLTLIDSNDNFFGISSSSQNVVSKRRFIEMIRSNSYSFSDSWENFSSKDFTSSSTIAVASGYNPTSASSSYRDALINIEPIVAYQLSCAQFGTNDFVDFIYSADLYRQNMLAIYYSHNGSIPSFVYNGVHTFYDVFSYQIINTLTSQLSSGSTAPFNYFINLFSYVPSLRYGDYFTGSKPRPLAVGEYTAAVVDGSVSAIDVTKSIQMQRLLNRVNMVGRKLGDYLSGIFGGQLPEAPKDVPLFLAHQSFSIRGFETENTGDIQFSENNTITSHLRSTENRHSFDIEISEPCYIIGMNSYSSMRIYSRGIDRFAFHQDRYDDFIPEMQYIGDQDIKLAELDSSYNSLAPFGYTLRYMEYKQRPSYASGGFIDQLPTWAFITDNQDGNPSGTFISPDYIRSSPSEFDRFYRSLNGYSLGTYFHFIVAHTNVTEPVRQMEYAPEILK